MKRVAGKVKPKSLAEAVSYFEHGTENAASFLLSLRWPKGVRCPVCGNTKLYTLPNRWECNNGHRHRTFTLKTGTLFEDSALPVSKWLIAIWMSANDPEPNSHALARAVGVTQKTAWLMLLKIKLAVRADEQELGNGTADVTRTKARIASARK